MAVDRLRPDLLGTLVTVSQVERDTAAEALRALSDEDRAWLEERLTEYGDLLTYLHDH